MDNILAWLSSTTGIITTFTAFMVAILLFIENSKKLVFKPLTKIFTFMFGWLHQKEDKEIKALMSSVKSFMNKSDERDDIIIGMVNNLSTRINDNECDRIRAEMFNYGRISRGHGHISTEEWRHIQDIYYKYHEILHGNGQVTEEYNYIKEYYYSQFANQEEGEE